MVRGGTWWVIPISGVPSHRNVAASDLAVPDQQNVPHVTQNRLSVRRMPRRVPDNAGTAPALAAPDQAALTSIILRVALGAGTLTSSMPFASVASTWAASTPSGSVKLRWNAPYASSWTK